MTSDLRFSLSGILSFSSRNQPKAEAEAEAGEKEAAAVEAAAASAVKARANALVAAIDEVQNPPLLGSQDGRSQQGLVFASRSSSFPRVPPRSRTLVGPKAWAAPGVVWAQASGGADRAGAASAAPVRSCRCHRSSTSARRLQRQTT